MSSLDLLTLGHVVRNGNYAQLLATGWSPEDLQTTQGKALHALIETYYNTPATLGSTPDLHFLRAYYPDLELPDTANTPLKELVANARTHRITLEARRKVDELKKLLNDAYNPHIVSLLTDHLSELESLVSLGTQATDMGFAEGMSLTLNTYEKLRSGELTYMPWPWPQLSKWSPGIKPEDYIVIYGRPKNKKTFVLLYFVLQHFLAGGKVLLYSKEMPVSEIWERVVAFAANLLLDDLTLACMGPEEEGRLYDTDFSVRDRIHRSKGANDIICVSGLDAPGGSDTVSWLMGKVRQHRPTLIVVDGMYLMSGPKTKDLHERIAEISKGLRSIALKCHIPVIATSQANRKVGNKAALETESDLDDVGFSDALGRDATALIRVVADRTAPTATCLFTGARSIRLAGFSINAVPCTDFSWIGPIDRSQAVEAQRMDDEEELPDPLTPPAPLPPQLRTRKRKKSTALERALEGELNNER